MIKTKSDDERANDSFVFAWQNAWRNSEAIYVSFCITLSYLCILFVVHDHSHESNMD